jgi:hypothetical protein
MYQLVSQFVWSVPRAWVICKPPQKKIDQYPKKYLPHMFPLMGSAHHGWRAAYPPRALLGVCVAPEHLKPIVLNFSQANAV